MAKQGLSVKIDTRELEEFSRRSAKASKLVTPTLAVGLNEIGDSLISLMAQNLSKDTGLSLEQVRGLFKVQRAKRNDLEYEITINTKLLEEGADDIEGGRESSDFGKRRPGALVIIVSQKDDLVCMDCEELEAIGPMPVEQAKAHLPVHPNCRCIIMPYVQKRRRLPVTMTTVTGTSSRKRGASKPIKTEVDTTLRQLAQSILDKSASTIRLELS